MITETNPRPSKKATGIRIGIPNPSVINCREKELLFPFYRKSFRSGSSFNVLSGNNYTVSQMYDQTLIENLMRVTGADIGHEYERRQITSIFSSFHKISGVSSLLTNEFLPRTFLVPSGTGLLNATQILSFVSDTSTYIPDATLVTEGTRLINLTNPIKAPVNLATSLSEMLFDGLPKNLGKVLIGSAPNKRELIRALGGEYLSYMFGFSPVVRDIADLVTTLRRSHEIIEQWKRNDGRQVRRRRAWDRPDVLTTYNKTLSGGLGVSAIIPTSATNRTAKGTNYSTTKAHSGWIESNTKTTTKYSFSSSFEYQLENLIPEYPEPIRSLIFGNASNEAIVDALLLQRLSGLDPTSIQSASTYWNVLPYSWLVDWFVNIGDLMSSVTAFQQQGLKLLFGYMSVHQTSRFSADYRFTYDNSLYAGVVTLEGSRDRRIRATPYGFGTSFAGLSPTQLSLLAALITSGRRV
jgi:hypothetical protein